MILYYALGGGLGHLTRGRRVLEALGLATDAAFVTASVYAADTRVTGGIPVIEVPSHLESDVAAHRAWLRELECDRLIADTFPCGIQGELCELDAPMDLVARRLRWDEYRRAVPMPLPRFGTVWCVEDLEPAHKAALQCDLWSAEAALPLCNVREWESGGVASALHGFWLIVHSGPEDEVRELVAYAQELLRVASKRERVLVATRCTIALPNGFELIDAYPVTRLFEPATCIISAAGFNIMLETEPYRDKHHAVPFARKFDDQYARASRRRMACF
jgi:hypothetical protein